MQSINWASGYCPNMEDALVSNSQELTPNQVNVEEK